MKKGEKKKVSTGRTICTRSSAVASASTVLETTPLRRSTRGTPSTKPITPASSTRRSGRLASSPASVTKISGGTEKKPTASPLRRSGKGKTVASENPKGLLDKPDRNANTSSLGVEESNGKRIDIIEEESTDEIKKGKPEMTARSLRALYRGHLNTGSNEASSNDEELVVVGCSRRVPAENDDARDDNSPPHANSGSKGLPVGDFSLEKGPDFPMEVARDTEKTVVDSSPMVETGDDSVIGSSSVDPEPQKLCDSETSLETDIDLALKRKRDTAENDDARDGNSPPHANSGSKGLPVGETGLEKGSDFPVEVTKDIEKTVVDSSPMVETEDGSVIGSPSENPEPQKLRDSETSLETDIDLALKRKRDTAEIVMDACTNADDRIMILQKFEGSMIILKISVFAPALLSQFKDLIRWHRLDMKDCGPAKSKDYGENRQKMQQDKSFDPKLLSMYTEYWVPVQLSDVQVEQYCRTLFSNSLSLSSMLKNDLVGALEETLTSVRKVMQKREILNTSFVCLQFCWQTCDHPYVMDVSLKQLLTKNLKLHEILDVEVKASGKLPLLGAMLTQIKAKGLKAVVFYQATHSPEGLLLGNILEDFLMQRFGQNSYEHGVCLSKKNAINNFNKESECFILLLEIRACSQSIKLLRAESFILFGSSLNPSHDVKLLEKIKVESCSERTKIFRLYSVFTVEEKALILARQNKPLENLNRPLTHALLMWGASYLFDKLEHFHGSGTPGSGVPFEQSIKDAVIQEFSSILSSDVGEENEGKLCLLLEAKHAQGSYSTDATLFGEEHVKLSDESPNMFWSKLLSGKNPMWKYCSDTPQRSRKRVRHLQGYEETIKVRNGGNLKKKKKASDDVTVDNAERKASGKDHMGHLESPNVATLKSSRGSASGTNDSLTGNGATGLYSLGCHISGVPEDMLSGIDGRQIPHESQRSLYAVLKPKMAKLCPSSWIAASLVKQTCNREESLVRAKSELGFSCSEEEVDYIYSLLCCMKSIFLGRTRSLQVDCLGTNSKQAKVNESLSGDTVRQEQSNTKSMRSSVTKDVEKTISDIKNKCSKKLQELVQIHEEKKVDLMNRSADKKQELQNGKKLEVLYIRVTCSGLSSQSLLDNLQRVEDDFERKNDDLKIEMNDCLKKLEGMHEAEKKKLAEDEAYWISRIENWAQAQAELIDCAPIQSGSNKHLSGLRSSNTSKNTPDVQTCSDASGEATYADTSCMVAKENQLPETENTLRTMSGGSTQQVHEIVASRNDKALDISPVSHEQPTDNVATKSQPNEPASLSAPDILIPAGCQEESGALNVHSSEYPNCVRVTSAAPDEDVPSRVAEISQSVANLAKSASLESWLNREEALVSIENDKTIHSGADTDNIFDHQYEEACSLYKEIPDELVSPIPHPAPALKTRDSAESDQGDDEICPLPSSPAGQQPDPAEKNQGKNVEASIESQPAVSESVEAGGFAAFEQGDQVACPLPSSPTGNQPDSGANVESQNISISEEPHNAGPGVVETGVTAVSDQMAELQAEYQRKFHEVEAEHTAKATKLQTSKNFVIMNKLLTNAFLSKCTSRMESHPSAAPRGRIQQLAQRAVQMSALRNYYTASAPAPLQPHTSSVSRSPYLPPSSTHCPMPQPRQPLISNPAPSFSASPASAPNLAVNGRLVSPALPLNPYSSSSSPVPIPTTTTPTSSAVPQALTYSSSVPIPTTTTPTSSAVPQALTYSSSVPIPTTTTPTSSAVPQALTYSTALAQQQEQQQNLGSGSQRSSDVVCLSDDE
ncbi:hypothetical protein F2Q69_00026065 [Brassica cretica]|uniref:MOM1 alpha-helical domain-containing protein n=1 Tax=Brassica cretica TaxID=69181 RepID=A0A8S9SAF6_BRACR|nr:hypothetical protein F2Q69_00026065 [Brassica cretica]